MKYFRSFSGWNQSLAKLLDPGLQDSLPENLVAGCDALVPSDSAFLVVCGETIKPLPLFDNIPADVRHQHIEPYLDGAYLLDPYYRAGISGVPSGLYSLAEVAPAGFDYDEYFLRYYRDSKIIAELGFITALPDGYFSILSLAMHEGSRGFDPERVELLRTAQPIVDMAIARYWRGIQEAGGQGVVAPLHSQLETALELFGHSVLTGREAEVIRMYLHGHATSSIAEKLSITTHTVAMHRKNAYSRLDICSQFELFHLFIDSLSCFDPDAKDDPLRAYLQGTTAT
ncbi:MAG: LuxR C-terminal-related transcriptional regulator [Pseudomonadota bacterium]